MARLFATISVPARATWTGRVQAHDPFAKTDAYFELLDELRAILGVEVDLVMAGAVKNRYIAREIQLTRQTLYAA